MLKRLLLLPVLLVLWPLVALAQVEALDAVDPAVLFQLVIGAAKAGHWTLFAALLLAGGVLLLKRFLAPRYPLFATKPGVWLLALAGALVPPLISAAATLSLPSGAAVLAALGVWFTSIGGIPAVADALLPLLLKIPFVAKLAPPTKAEVVKFEPAPAVAPVKSDDIANGP